MSHWICDPQVNFWSEFKWSHPNCSNGHSAAKLGLTPTPGLFLSDCRHSCWVWLGLASWGGSSCSPSSWAQWWVLHMTSLAFSCSLSQDYSSHWLGNCLSSVVHVSLCLHLRTSHSHVLRSPFLRERKSCCHCLPAGGYIYGIYRTRTHWEEKKELRDETVGQQKDMKQEPAEVWKTSATSETKKKKESSLMNSWIQNLILYIGFRPGGQDTVCTCG